MAARVLSLRAQLLAWLLPVAALSLIAGTFGVYLIALNASADAVDKGLADAMEIYIEHLRAHPGDGAQELPPRAQRMLLAAPEDRLYFSLLDANGHLLAGDGNLGDERAWGTLRAPAFFDANYAGYWLRGISVVFDVGGSARHLILASTALKREQLMDSILLGMVAPQTVLFLATIGLVWAGIRQGLAPLAAVRAEIAQRSHQDLRPLETDAVPDELRPMVEDINRLFERLRRKIEVQRHFVADAAHQLRTPVAALMAQVEASGQRDEALLGTTRRLSHLVAQLLALSRAEPGIKAPTEPFDLAAQIRAAANDWLPLAFRRDMDVAFDLAETVITGSPHALREALANLVDNAVCYGKTHGRMVIRCRPQGNEAVIVVEDDGPGIPAELRRQVFERFYRAPGSPGEGCGLGLAIVEAFVRQHGGTVTLGQSPELGGLRVDIRIPRSNA